MQCPAVHYVLLKWRMPYIRQLPTSWQGTAFSVHSCNVGRKALKKRYKSITDRMRRSGAGRESDERSLSVICLFHPSCDIINHKNTTARVNVTGSIRVKPGSRCPCERGVFVQGYRALVTTHGQHLVEWKASSCALLTLRPPKLVVTCNVWPISWVSYKSSYKGR